MAMTEQQENALRESLSAKTAQDLIDWAVSAHKRAVELMHYNSAMAGKFSHMTRAMNAREIPNIRPIHMRFDLLCLELDQARISLKKAKIEASADEKVEGMFDGSEDAYSSHLFSAPSAPAYQV